MTVLFVDAENINLMEEDLFYIVYRFGLSDVRVYTTPDVAHKYATFHTCLHLSVVEVRTERGKNSIDIQMAIDIIEMSIATDEERFVIASHDRDFIPVFSRLREYGKHVSVIGNDEVSARVVSCVDEVFLTSAIHDHLKVFLKAFLVKDKKNRLSLTEFKKNIKKIKGRKCLGAAIFKTIGDYVETAFPLFFSVEKHGVATYIVCIIIPS